MASFEWLPDPTGRFDHRLRVDGAWSATVSRGGEQLTDPDGAPPSGSAALATLPPPVAAPETASPPTERRRTTGDAIVHALGTVTLANWGNKLLHRSMGVPVHVEAVQAAPTDLRRRLHLGIRLREASKVKAVIDGQFVYTGPIGLVTRPVTRAAGRALSNSLRSDTRPAHQQVLQPLHALLAGRVADGSASIDDLVMLARISWEAVGTPQAIQQAMDIITTATEIDPDHATARYVGAEILIDLGQPQLAVSWARHAYHHGSFLAPVVLRDDAPARRAAFRQPRRSGLLGYHVDDFLVAENRYFEGVPPTVVQAHYGPLGIDLEA